MAAPAYIGRLRVMQEPPADYTVDGVVPTFSALPHAVLFDNELSRDARLLYAMLQSHWWQGGECWASHATLAAQIGCKERMLRYYLRELIAAGYVTERRRGRGQAKAYAPSQAARDCQLKRQGRAGSDANRQEIAGQPAISCRLNRQPVANRRRSSEVDPPEEVDTGGSVAADAAPPLAPVEVSAEKRRATRKPRAVKTPAPDEFPLTDRHLSYAAGLGFGAEQAAQITEQFLSYHRFKGTLGLDWYAGWQQWMRRQTTYDSQRPRQNGSYRPASPGEPVSDEMRERIDARSKRTAGEILAAARARKGEQP